MRINRSVATTVVLLGLLIGALAGGLMWSDKLPDAEAAPLPQEATTEPEADDQTEVDDDEDEVEDEDEEGDEDETDGEDTDEAAEMDAETEVGLTELTTARDSGQVCSATAQAQLNACQNEVRDDFFVATAICLNVIDDEERTECLADAENSRREDNQLCAEQQQARLDLCQTLGEEPYAPNFDPADFDSDLSNLTNPNPYYPLAIGNVREYVGGEETIRIEVLDKTKLIEGVTCIVVNDVVDASSTGGRLPTRTSLHRRRFARTPHPAYSDAPSRPIAKEKVNLSTILTDVTESLRLLAEEKQLTLTTSIPTDLTIPGDSDALIRLFVNMIANAINYTKQGQIGVTANSGSNGFVEVTITDTGVGIPARHLPHIFDRFYRVDPSRSTNGTGLGLAIAMNVARNHGGTITVDSKAGQGTKFTVALAAH